MGFMDKAKKLAEQAQSKLDEVQTQFNEKQSASSSSGGPAVDYDKHGRPTPATPAETATPPHGDPVAGSAPPVPPVPPVPPAPDAAAPPIPPAPPATPPAAPPAAPPSPAGATSSDDPYEPPKMSSGDPLAG